MRVLITRPREDAETLAASLSDSGIESLIEPLLEIHPRPGAVLDFDGAQAALLTSANGARMLASLSRRRDIPVLAVGDTTARVAGEAGFAKVESAGGKVDDLARLVAARLRPGGGRLVHIAGTDVSGDLAALLAPQGFSVERAVVYEARPVTALSAPAVAALRKGAIDAALFFSPRTASAFVRLARGAGVAEACATIDAICLSDAVATALAPVNWRARRVAERPDGAALLACVAALRAELA